MDTRPLAIGPTKLVTLKPGRGGTLAERLAQSRRTQRRKSKPTLKPTADVRLSPKERAIAGKVWPLMREMMMTPLARR